MKIIEISKEEFEIIKKFTSKFMENTKISIYYSGSAEIRFFNQDLNDSKFDFDGEGIKFIIGDENN